MMKCLKSITRILIAISIIAINFVGFINTPESVYADTASTDLTANGQGTYNFTDSYTTVSYPGGSDYQVVKSNDDGTSYVRIAKYYADTGGWASVKGTYEFTDFSASHTAINSVTVTARVYHNYIDAANSYICYYNHASTYQGSANSITSGAWTTITKTWTTNPATGSAWTASEISNNEFGVISMARDWSGYFTALSYIKVTVSYETAVVPAVTTSAVSAITATAATGNGNVTSDGGAAITERGTVISTSVNPTTADTKDTTAGTTGVFTTSITGLTKNTTYHVRAYAINSTGTSYGSDVEFKTSADPTVSTVAASQIAATTARINSNVTNDGEEECTVTFVYTDGTGFADYAAVKADASSTETAVSGTYETGDLPYLDITGLTVSTSYSFAVKVTNTVSSAYGSVLTFTTKSGITEPTNLIALPSDTSVSLVWEKGVGSTYSLLKYSLATYPAAIADGTTGYLGTGNSVNVTGFTPGTTVYWSIWGMSGGTYSDNYTMTLCTTLAYGTDTDSDIDIDVPAANSSWVQTPSESKLQNVPGLNAVVAMWNDNYKIPDAMIWYFLWFMIGVGGGIVLYNRTSYNLEATFGAEIIWFGFGAALGLVMLWIIFVLLIISMGFKIFGDRR